MAEKTLVVAVNYLREGQDWAWMPDVNMVLVRNSLDEAGVRRALIAVGVEWRRSYLSVVKAS